MATRYIVAMSMLAITVLLAAPAFELYLLDDTGQHMPKAMAPFEAEVDRWFNGTDGVECRALKAAPLSGETATDALRRLERQLPPLPPGYRLVPELRGERWLFFEARWPPLLEPRDVAEGSLEQGSTTAADDVEVRLLLTPEAAQRLEAATAAALRRRAAVVIDGRLETAAVMQNIQGPALMVIVGKNRVAAGRSLLAALARGGTHLGPDATRIPAERPWVRVEEAHRFEILFPKPASRTTRTLPGEIVQTTYATAFGELRFAASWAPKQGKHPLAESVDRTILSSERVWGSRAVREASFSLSGYPGVALWVPPGRSGIASAQRMFEVGPRLYSLSVTGPAEEVRGALARRFFDSFHISE